MKDDNKKGNILVAPLNWGLGHATRCIPIIKALEENNFTPILASDGQALALLKKEFPHLIAIELASYQIEYSKKAAFFKLKLFSNLPKIIKAVLTEKKATQKIIDEFNIKGIISDNRLGVRSSKIVSVFITHQLNVLTGNTSWLTSYFHRTIIAKYDQCWVPDVDTKVNLSGILGNPKKKLPNVTYIGPLSRFHKKELVKKYDLMVVLSGPEPQRSLLEEKLLQELKNYQGEIVFIKGKMEELQTIEKKSPFTIYNYMNSVELEQTFNESDCIISRSGYTTVMDLAALEKKAFFIPTPGQYEQEYLAKKYQKELLAPFCKQSQFTLDKLFEIHSFTGFRTFSSIVPFEKMFAIFDKA